MPCLLGAPLNVPGNVTVTVHANGPAYASQGDTAAFTNSTSTITTPYTWSNSFLGLGANVAAGDVTKFVIDGGGLVGASGSGSTTGQLDVAKEPIFQALNVLEFDQWSSAAGSTPAGSVGKGLPLGPVTAVENQGISLAIPVATTPVTDTLGDPNNPTPVDPPINWDAPNGTPSSFTLGPATVTGAAGSNIVLSLDTAKNGVVSVVDGFGFTDTANMTIQQYGNPPEPSGIRQFNNSPTDTTPVLVGPLPVICTAPANSVLGQAEIVAPAAVTTSPTSQSTNVGTPVTFTAAATGTPPPTVQWQSSPDGTNWTNIAGATSSSYTVSNPQLSDSGTQYRAVFTVTTVNNSTSSSQHTFVVNTANSNAATLTVTQPLSGPTITTQPSDQTVLAGQNASFTSAATGNPAPTVQWQVSTNSGGTWSNVSGATSPTLTITGATAGQNGNQYRAVWSNSQATVNSSAATLHVNTAPVVTTQPADTTVTAGQNASFTAAASGTPTPTVQWQVSTNGGSTWTNDTTDSGNTTGTLTVSAVAQSASGNQYRAVFTNAAGSATSSAATLTVNTVPVVTTQPSSQTVTSGNNATFTAAASGSPAPTVQWQVSTDGGSTYTDVPGATSATLTVSSVPQSDSGNKYHAVFTNAAGTATSNAATLTVQTAPSVTTQPTSTTVNAGQTATFTAAASGTPPPSVQWQSAPKGSSTFSNVSGATSGTLTVNATAALDGTQYRAVFTNTAGTATSNVATLTVDSAPAITQQPTDQSAANGGSATFTAAASGNPAPTVQWQVSTDGGSTFSNVSGATSTTLTVPSVAATDSGNQYRAVFTNIVGTATSNAATLTVTQAPVVTAQPSSTTVTAGQNATFTSTATGNPAPTVQWQVSTNGGSTFSNVSGATSTTLTVSTTAADNGNQYRAVFTNTSGSATSNAAKLTVNSGPAVTTQPSNATVAPGANATFTAAASGNPAPTVQWQVSTDGGSTFSNVSGATSTTLTVPSVAVTDSGNQYRAVFTNTVGTATSNAATLTVQSAPVVTTQPSSTTVNAGQTATFTAAASGSPAPTVQWQVSTNGGSTFSNVSGATSTTLTVSATAADNGNQYRAVFTNTAGSATTSAATLTVDSAPAVTTQPTNQSVTVGANATFTAAASGNPAPTVQWQSSTDGTTWTNIAGATSATYTVSGATLAQSGTQYRAVFTNSVGSATSNAATLTVTQANLPVVTSVLPHRGGAFSLVFISGKNLGRISSVSFGSQKTLYLQLSSSFVIALAPYGPTGTVDVTVTNASGTSLTSSADQFTYTRGFFW